MGCGPQGSLAVGCGLWDVDHGKALQWGVDHKEALLWGVDYGMWGVDHGKALLWGVDHGEALLWTTSTYLQLASHQFVTGLWRGSLWWSGIGAHGRCPWGIGRHVAPLGMHG